MKNEVVLFTNKNLGTMRTVVIGDELWFVGKDVATMLGYKDPSKVIRDMVDKEYKQLIPIKVGYREQNTTFINEAGFDMLIQKCRKPNAESMKTWVKHEVLPSVNNGIVPTSNNEIELLNRNNQVVVSSLRVAEDFDKKHKNVLKEIEKLTAQNVAVNDYFAKTYYTKRGKNYPLYYMNRDGFSLLAMGFTGQKALEWKLKYIHAFNKMEQKIREDIEAHKDSYMIEDPVKRAMRWAEEEKKRQALEQKVQELSPKADYFDRLVNTDLLTNFRDTAKEFNVTQKELVDDLLAKGYIYRDYNNRLKPYMKFVKSGLFKVKEYQNRKTLYHGVQTLITPRGRDTFRLFYE